MPPTLLDSLKQTAQDKLWWVVGGTALLSGICGAFAHGWKGLTEGLSIIVAAAVIMLISTVADLMKDRRFVGLQSLVKEESVPVIRGKFGATQTISVWDVVVGDVILLTAGARVPADCLVVEAADLEVEEDGPEAGRSDVVRMRKNAVSLSAESVPSGDPFLRADSLLVQGKCKAVVCVVGAQSSRGSTEEKMDTSVDTNLQKKLSNLAGYFTTYSLYAAAVIFLVMTIMLIIEVATIDSTDPNATGAAGIIFAGLTSQINFIVVLIVVSVPEGLPLAIGVSLAFSVMKMYGDNLLVRKLDAPEKMGAIEEILCGKTGTITTGNMKIANFFIEGKEVKNSRKNTIFNCELSDETKRRVQESVLYNCEARVEMDSVNYVPVGSGTEVGFLRFLQDADVPIHLLIQKKLGRVIASCPHSTQTKRSAVVLESPDEEGQVIIYVKGAPEVIADSCSHKLMNDGIHDYTEDDRSSIYSKTHEFATNRLRVLGFSYRVMDKDTWFSQYQGDLSPEEALATALNQNTLDLTFLAIFGLKDPLRDRVISCVKFAREDARLQVRMVSGDHVDTATQVALKAGIIRNDEIQKKHCVMHADQFRELVGGVTSTLDNDGREVLNVENPSEFRSIIQNLKVLARATSEDKYVLAVGLKALERMVAVTGDGITDKKILEVADVGLAMGSGCSAAKEVSSIVLTTNDFEASLRAVMWGRNIYHNISRFIQFQVTVNISALLTIFIGIILFNQHPINSVQLLWINLIMDTAAALALATEPPLPSVINGPPFTEKVALLSNTVWRQILSVSLWNTFIMVMVMFFGRLIGGLDEYHRSTPLKFSMPTDFQEHFDAGDLNSEDEKYVSSQALNRHLTYIFNIFVCLQMFNMINCRKIGKRDFNVFEAFFHNAYFLVIFVVTFVMQYLLVNYFSGISQTIPLTRSEWGSCIVVGTSALLISFIVKCTPEKWVEGVDASKFINEDKEVNNKVLSTYQKAADAAAPPSNRGSQQQEKQSDIEMTSTNNVDDEFTQAP